MGRLDDVREFSCDVGDEEVLLAEGFEDAFIGIVRRCSKPPLACYDYGKAVAILMQRDGATREEAVEFLDFNSVDAWAGEHTPVWLFRFESKSDRPVPPKKLNGTPVYKPVGGVDRHVLLPAQDRLAETARLSGITYLVPGEEKFVTDARKTLKEMPERVHWILSGPGPGDEVVGMLAFGSDKDEKGDDCYWIHRIMIRPERRRKGYAQKALKAAIDSIPYGTEILTSIVTGNKAAPPLFRKLGFVRTTRKWGTKETIYRFRKRRYNK